MNHYMEQGVATTLDLLVRYLCLEGGNKGDKNSADFSLN